MHLVSGIKSLENPNSNIGVKCIRCNSSILNMDEESGLAKEHVK